ncbi:CopD family protein [Streptomyces sp. NPDC046887]|uniref:CopD family protein n=1 Tax=Streptomyces sp. NPDC046887 TaxID=3155472 RepID=UPI0033CE4760
MAPALGALLAAAALAYGGAALAGYGTGELSIPGGGATTLLRAAVFVALAVHLGELAGARIAGPGPLPRPWGRWAALLGAAACFGQIAVLAQVSRLDLTAAYSTREGGLLLATANGFALAAAAAGPRRPAWAVAPLALVVVTEAWRAHPEAYTPEYGAALTVVHLTAASLWVGGLLHVVRTLRLRPDGGGRRMFARYARLAGWLYAALAATGLCSTLRRLPADVVFSTAYGRVLMAKLLLMAVVSAYALAAHRRLRRHRDPDGAAAPARTELVALAAVVVVSAVLTVVPDPHWLSLR